MNLLIRADSSSAIGTGHVMRCLALAQGWKRLDGAVCFVMAEVSKSLEQRICDEGMNVCKISTVPGSVEDSTQMLAIAMREKADAVVLDGYQFDSAYQRTIKSAGFKLLCIDDYGHTGSYCADFILNQNLSADASMYGDRAPYTKLLLGTRYALLRQEFRERRLRPRTLTDRVRTILVTMGGADRVNGSIKVVQALGQLDASGIEALVIVGAENLHMATLETAVRESQAKQGGVNIRLLQKVEDMAGLMAEADLAISATGSTCWELAFMGIPSILVVLSENQKPIAERMKEEGIASSLGWHGDVSSEMIARELARLMGASEVRLLMSERGRMFVDGEGVQEVLMRLGGSRLGLRRARKEDCEIAWRWANDPVARELSFSMDPIPWEDHVRWFGTKISDASCVYYIATDDDDVPVGQVRFDIDNRAATISVSIDRGRRGLGYGRDVIRQASKRLFDNSGVDEIHAYVKPSNEQSLHVFAGAGFTDAGIKVIHGQAVRHMMLSRGCNL